jgi:hypothetical protein
VQTRVSGVMTNAPFMLNVDCDMFANNPKVILHAMCLLLGFDDEVHSGFVQAPQKFHNALKDDPFGNQLEVIIKVHTYAHQWCLAGPISRCLLLKTLLLCSCGLRKSYLGSVGFKACSMRGPAAFTGGKLCMAPHHQVPLEMWNLARSRVSSYQKP